MEDRTGVGALKRVKDESCNYRSRKGLLGGEWSGPTFSPQASQCQSFWEAGLAVLRDFHQGDSVASPSLPACTRSLTEKFPCGALQADAMAGMTHLLFLMVSTHRSSWKCLPKRASLVH